MIPFPGFTGPSYELRNRWASVEKLCNWYCLPNESRDNTAKFEMSLEPCPGNAAFCPLPVPAPFNQPARGMLELRGVAYGVNGTTFFTINQLGVFTQLGVVNTDHKPVSMVANGNGQIFIASAGLGYVYDTKSTIFTPVLTGDFLGAQYATFQDGYILVIKPNSNEFQISGSDDTPLGDATQWDAANVAVLTGQADFLQAILSSREYVRILGKRRSEIWYNVGTNGIGQFPFSIYNDTFIETGISAIFSLVDLGDSHIWIGEDSRGVRACWQDSAFQPQRVSNFSVEQQWQNYARIDDAVAFSFLWRGHLMYQITFPSAVVNNPPTGFPMAIPPPITYTGKTWVLDMTASMLTGRPMWHERSYQTSMGYAQQRSEMFHCYVYGRHLVSSVGIDGNAGAVYQYSDGQAGFEDCGTDITGAQTQQPIVRDRIVSGPWESNKRIIINRIEYNLARGVGLDGAPPVGVNPVMLQRWSRDGGNTFSAEQEIDVGLIGQYGKRVYWNRPWSGRNIVLWVRCTDPVYWSLLNAGIDAFECTV